jgi:hypothetical protein
VSQEIELILYVSAWLVATSAVLARLWKKKRAGAGLAFAYFASLSLIHLPGAAIYILPWYWNHDLNFLLPGFKLSTYAVIAFGIGAAVFAPFLMRVFRFPPPVLVTRMPERRLSFMYIGIGLFSYLVLLPLARNIPSATALVAAGWQLVVAGLCLGCWKEWQRRRRRRFTWWLAAALLLPFLTVITQGFLGYGTVAFLTVFGFVSTFYRPRWKLVALGFILVYLGFSFYVSYMRDRVEIRQVVWGGESIGRRVEQMYITVSQLEWFNPYDNSHLRRVDDRLNQNYLVAAAISHLRLGAQEFARGDTLVQALIALVPRAIWPSKPVVAGSMGLAATYTGLTFAVGTSVGIGHVLEFYINFGTVGVLVGFLVLGIAVSAIDKAANERVVRGDWQGFVLWYLPGIAFLGVGGSLVELTAGAGAAVVTALLVNRYLLPRLRGRRISRFRRPIASLPGARPQARPGAQRHG